MKNEDVYVIECNLRASRSMPFSSKSSGLDLMDLAAEAIFKGRLPIPSETLDISPTSYFMVKTPQFSWAQIRGSYPYLGPEMRSTGEVASLGECFEEALLKSWLSAQPNRLPKKSEYILVYSLSDGKHKKLLENAARELSSIGYRIVTIRGYGVRYGKIVGIKEAESMIREGRIGLILTHGFNPKIDYVIRRTAVDFNVPIVLNANLACYLAKAIVWYEKKGILKVKELSEYWLTK